MRERVPRSQGEEQADQDDHAPLQSPTQTASEVFAQGVAGLVAHEVQFAQVASLTSVHGIDSNVVVTTVSQSPQVEQDSWFVGKVRGVNTGVRWEGKEAL